MTNIVNPTLPYVLTNGTLADATQVMAIFNYIVAQINANATPIGTISGGALNNIQVISASGTYNASAGTEGQLIYGAGAGGAGGGTATIGLGHSGAAGSGGGSGASALIWVPSGLTSTTVTIGAGGTGVSGGNGGNGGSSSFGGYLILPGGIGGLLGPDAGGGNTAIPPGGLPAAPSGSATIIFSNQGNPGRSGFIVTDAQGGYGGSSPLGTGGIGASVVGASVINPSAGQGFGSGGGAAGLTGSGGSSTPAQAGLAGAAAAFIIFELA